MVREKVSLEQAKQFFREHIRMINSACELPAWDDWSCMNCMDSGLPSWIYGAFTGLPEMVDLQLVGRGFVLRSRAGMRRINCLPCQTIRNFGDIPPIRSMA